MGSRWGGKKERRSRLPLTDDDRLGVGRRRQLFLLSPDAARDRKGIVGEPRGGEVVRKANARCTEDLPHRLDALWADTRYRRRERRRIIFLLWEDMNFSAADARPAATIIEGLDS